MFSMSTCPSTSPYVPFHTPFRYPESTEEVLSVEGRGGTEVFERFGIVHPQNVFKVIHLY